MEVRIRQMGYVDCSFRDCDARLAVVMHGFSEDERQQLLAHIEREDPGALLVAAVPVPDQPGWLGYHCPECGRPTQYNPHDLSEPSPPEEPRQPEGPFAPPLDELGKPKDEQS